MDKKNLIWIIPLCLIIGYLFGLYFNIPQNITIDYGDNIVSVVEKLDNMNLSLEHCPDCICDNPTTQTIKCSYKDGNGVV